MTDAHAKDNAGAMQFGILSSDQMTEVDKILRKGK